MPGLLILGEGGLNKSRFSKRVPESALQCCVAVTCTSSVQAFVRGDLNNALTAPGIADILEFKFVPFGNAYFSNNSLLPCPAVGTPPPLSDCEVEGFRTYYDESDPNPANWTTCSSGGPDESPRACWQEACGNPASGPSPETYKELCTSGAPVYQHGPGEGLADVLEACAMHATGTGAGEATSSYMLWFPFVHCLEVRGPVAAPAPSPARLGRLLSYLCLPRSLPKCPPSVPRS